MHFLRNDLPYNPVPFYGERAPWVGGDLQTMRNTILRTYPPLAQGQDRLFTLPDGDRLLGAYHSTNHGAEDDTAKALIVIAHGLAGDYDSSYVRFLADAALSQNYDVLRLNLRGAGKASGLARASYHAGRADDLSFVLHELAKENPALPLCLCAFSLGGTMAVNLVSRHKVPANLCAVTSFCAPLDMVESAHCFHAPRNRLYNRHFTKNLITMTLSRMEKDPSCVPPGLTEKRLRQVKTVREFDDIFTSKIAGYEDADAYYHGTTPLAYLGDISVPTLVVHSDNDPLIPDTAYWKIKPHSALFCVMTKGGGHVGFHGRRQPFDCWQSQIALQFFNHQL